MLMIMLAKYGAIPSLHPPAQWTLLYKTVLILSLAHYRQCVHTFRLIFTFLEYWTYTGIYRVFIWDLWALKG